MHHSQNVHLSTTIRKRFYALLKGIPPLHLVLVNNKPKALFVDVATDVAPSTYNQDIQLTLNLNMYAYSQCICFGPLGQNHK